MSQTLDTQLIEERRRAMNIWREVLNRIASVIRFLSIRGLPLKGTNEICEVTMMVISLDVSSY